MEPFSRTTCSSPAPAAAIEHASPAGPAPMMINGAVSMDTTVARADRADSNYGPPDAASKPPPAVTPPRPARTPARTTAGRAAAGAGSRSSVGAMGSRGGAAAAGAAAMPGPDPTRAAAGSGGAAPAGAAGRPGSAPVALDAAAVVRFRRRVCWHGRRHYRSLPWRDTGDPYAILVSEMMLQQTQVARVLGHYARFLARFPDPATLAAAPLAAVLERWSGLGYNRRAQALHRTAGVLVREHGGALPPDRDALLRLPGVGPATAGALQAFAFARPAVFIETNIRRVFLHQFFPAAAAVPDAALLPLVARTVDRRQPRRWYYALMDWGAALGRRTGNPNRRSAHYSRQTPFAGSRRELRGRVLRLLTEHRCLTVAGLQQRCADARLAEVVAALVAEQLLERAGAAVSLAGQTDRAFVETARCGHDHDARSTRKHCRERDDPEQ